LDFVFWGFQGQSSPRKVRRTSGRFTFGHPRSLGSPKRHLIFKKKPEIRNPRTPRPQNKPTLTTLEAIQGHISCQSAIDATSGW
jgi:hypothetical protein